jgi:hypothetical protein
MLRTTISVSDAPARRTPMASDNFTLGNVAPRGDRNRVTFPLNFSSRELRASQLDRSPLTITATNQLLQTKLPGLGAESYDLKGCCLGARLGINPVCADCQLRRMDAPVWHGVYLGSAPVLR